MRAVSAALNLSWRESYFLLCDKGAELCDLPSADEVWGAVLRDYGFRRFAITDCPECYTADDFAQSHSRGVYVLAFGGHVATLKNGELWDSWDSGAETPIYYFYGGR